MSGDKRPMWQIAQEQAPGLPWKEASDPHDSWDVAEIREWILYARVERAKSGGRMRIFASVRDVAVRPLPGTRLDLAGLAEAIRAEVERQAAEHEAALAHRAATHRAEVEAALRALVGGGR